MDRFDGHGGASECVFSYPNKDWFGVYLLDSAGNKVEWGEGYMKYYFKLKVNKLGSDAAVTEGTVDLPDDLKIPMVTKSIIVFSEVQNAEIPNQCA